MFKFYANVPATAPAAAGTAFLLPSQYRFPPEGLSLVFSGSIFQSVGISGGRYLFDPRLTLQPNTQYFLYTNAVQTTSGGGGIPGSTGYFATSATGNFVTLPQSPNFQLSGITAAVPEPSSLVLLATGLLWAVAMSRRRRRSVA